MCSQVFFCKYNDPIYVKLEKLDIMIALANERNIDQVLLELKEYATEVDVDFVRKVLTQPPHELYSSNQRIAHDPLCTSLVGGRWIETCRLRKSCRGWR